MQRLAEYVERNVKDFDASRIVVCEGRAPTHHVQGRLLSGSGLGEQQCPVIEVHGEETDSARDLRPSRSPSKPPRNHQVKDQEHLAFHFKDDSFPQPRQPDDHPSFDQRERRID